MFATISEPTMHRIRWALTICWLLMIASLFYDPISNILTVPTHLWSPFRIHSDVCVQVQGQCLQEDPYALGAPVFWGMVVPASIFILLVFGHELWRRICPLSFLSQIPRALGWIRKRRQVNSKTGKVTYKTVKIAPDSWLGRNHLYLQLGLFFLGLCNRILFVNSSRIALATFLLCTIGAAILVGYLYDGKAWCHYFCPMAPVQKIYGEPRGLFTSAAHTDSGSITQSMCRTVKDNGKEITACVACKAGCMDIDSERSYWDNIMKPEQQVLHYGYVGVVVGYFVYYFLYAGNWNYYLSGAWAHEADQIGQILKPGFYLFGNAIQIPKLVAAPVTLATFAIAGYYLGRFLEKRYRGYQLSQDRLISKDQTRHRIFTLCTFLIFNFFFVFAGHNFVVLLPSPLPKAFSIMMMFCSVLWLYRTYRRSSNLYLKERLSQRLRKQLHSKFDLNLEQCLEGRSLDDLTSDEVYVLAKVLPEFSKDQRLEGYKKILREVLEGGVVSVVESQERCRELRHVLDISDKEHDSAITELGSQSPELFYSNIDESVDSHVDKHDPGHLIKVG